MRQVSVGLRFFAAQKNLTRPTWLKPEERFAGVKPSEVMNYFKPEERLAGLSMAELEEQIKKRKQENGNQ